MIFYSLEKNMIYVIMQMTVLFMQLTSPFQYYHPDKNGKITGNEVEYSQNTLCNIKNSFLLQWLASVKRNFSC